MMQEDTPPNTSKTCLECGTPLGPGIEDRKYCNDSCRTAYNNRKRKEPPANPEETAFDPEQEDRDRDMAAIHKIYHILLDNRVKLYHMMGLYEHTLRLEDFNRFGVNLKYFTSECRGDYFDELVFRMCFDYGYHIDGDLVYLNQNSGEIYFN